MNSKHRICTRNVSRKAFCIPALIMFLTVISGATFAQTGAAIPVIGTNFTGSTYKFNVGYPPPDSMGAVGPNHFVELINARYAVYNKATGDPVQQSTLDEFWQASWTGGGGVLANPYSVAFPQSAAFDPRILYDNASGRWYATADGAMELLVAVSNTSDPTMGWKGYQIDNHASFDFAMSSTYPLADLIDDLNTANHGAPCIDAATCRVMQELASHIAFVPTEYLIFTTIEPNVRWGVLCRFPSVDGIGGCNTKSRLIRLENNQLQVYRWNDDHGHTFDFPVLGIDADNLYVTTQFNGSPFFVIPKEGLRNGTPPTLAGVTVIRNGPISGRMQPLVDLDGNGAGRALIVDASYVGLTLRRIARLGCNPSGPGACDTAGTVTLTRYTSPPRATQPGAKRSGASTHGIVVDESPLTSNVVLRNNVLHGVQTVEDEGGVARLRYFRVGVVYNAPPVDTFTFSLLDDTLVPNPATAPFLNAFYGSVAVNDDGQVVIGFTGSSAAQYASSYAVVGQLDSFLTHVTFGNPILLKAGHHEYELGAEASGPTAGGRNRLGDYSATTVDPSDPLALWTIQEWASALDVWSTQVTQIVLAPTSAAPRTTTVSASAVGNSHPSTTLKFTNVNAGDKFGDFDKGIAIQNGQFIIAPNLQLTTPRQAYTASSFPLGDGRDEVTYGSLNFAEDPGYSNFSHFQVPRPVAPLEYAVFELSLLAQGDCTNDMITLGNLPAIALNKIVQSISSKGCASGDQLAGTVNLLNFPGYSSADILNAIGATPWSLRFTYGSNAIVTLAGLTLGAPALFENGRVVSLVGDKDNFVAGDIVDTPPRSQRVVDLVNFIAADIGQDPGVDLDQGGANRPVGLTHYFAIPPQALITSAKVRFRVKSNDPLVYNDGLYYNDTVQASPLLPVIVLRDLLGREPHAGEVLDLEINLGKVPVRTVDTTSGPGGHWSSQPGAFRDLLGVLRRDNQLDLVFSDDLTVDYSELTVTFVLPGAPLGDLTGDNHVDQNDLNVILGALNTPSYGPGDPRDLDGDGKITALDARKLTLLCTRPRCAVQ